MDIKPNQPLRYKKHNFVYLDNNIEEIDIPEDKMDKVIKTSKERVKKDFKNDLKIIKNSLKTALKMIKKEKQENLKKKIDEILDCLEDCIDDLEEYSDYVVIQKDEDLAFFDKESPYRTTTNLKDI